MGEAIDTPFPPLTWDDSFWVGQVHLPSWVGFRCRRGAFDALRYSPPSDGTIDLIVAALDSDPRTPPTPAQAAAFRHLVDNEASIAAAVVRALFDHYADERHAYNDDPRRREELPEVAEPSGLRSLLELTSVHILSVAREGAAYVGFEFRCAWDGEDGAGVLTHRGRVVICSQADVVYKTLFARRDAEQGERGAAADRPRD
jgi:hypothetical protein